MAVAKPGAELLPAGDRGRFTVTRSPGDEYVFKVPTLRNIALTAPNVHTGSAWDLRQAVGVMRTSQLGSQLSSDEVDKITAFLGSLTRQPKGTVPILPPSVAAGRGIAVSAALISAPPSTIQTTNLVPEDPEAR